MKAIDPRPIDVKRAKTDIGYFAEEYLDIKLSAHQIQLVKTMVNGGEIAIGMRHGAQTAATVAIAWARRTPQRIKVERGIIDV